MFSLLVALGLIGAVSTSPHGAFFDKPAIYQVTQPYDMSEGPTWEPRKNMLYFVDIHSKRLLSYDYYTGIVREITLDGKVTPVVTSTDPNIVVVGVNRSVVAVQWDGRNQMGNRKILSTVADGFPDSRLNDGKVDSEGRLWFGTSGEEFYTRHIASLHGLLYKITKDNLENPTVEIAPVNISNGMAWNKANDKFYYIDSSTREIAEYCYDGKKGTISDRRTFFRLHDHNLPGIPDGMTIDEDDNLWIALYGGGSIIKVSKRGQLLQVIGMPARDVTSAIWGGPKLDVLFVTSARIDLTEREKRLYPAAGSVFAITNLKTKGKPTFNTNIVDASCFP